jgi:hypothetical protein
MSCPTLRQSQTLVVAWLLLAGRGGAFSLTVTAVHIPLVGITIDRVHQFSVQQRARHIHIAR